MAYLTRKELFLTVLSIPLGFLASVLATWFTTPTPRLEIRDSHTTVGGRTAISLRLENSGDLPLTRLVAKMRLKNPADISVEPAALAAHARISGTAVEFIPPDTFELKPSQALEFGFISNSLNAIADRDALPATVHAISVQTQQISARLPNKFGLPAIEVVPFIVGVSITINVMFLVFFIRFYRQLGASQPRTISKDGDSK